MLGITAPRACGHDLAHAGTPGMVQRQRVHHQVLVEEVGRPGLVGRNASDQSRHVQEDVDVVLLEEPLDIVGRVKSNSRCVTTKSSAQLFTPKLLDDMAAQETLATGDHDSFVLPVRHAMAPIIQFLRIVSRSSSEQPAQRSWSERIR